MHRPRVRPIVVIGASLGGPAALPVLLGSLPADFPGAVFVVLHLPIEADNLTVENLRPKVVLPITAASDEAPIVGGRIYVAPSDFHLTLEHNKMRVLRGPRENRARPAIDPLFRSAALTFGPGVVGVLLTGKLDDGVIGLNTIKTHGGTAIVQDPSEATAPDMIRNALKNVQVDWVLPLQRIAPQLVELAAKKIPRRQKHSSKAAAPLGIETLTKELGAPIPCVCPECHGPLWERKVGPAIEYRCHVGHSYQPEALLVDQDLDLERALWSAVRLFDEQASLLRRLAKRNVLAPLSGKWAKRASQNEANSAALRRLLQARRPV